MVSCRDRVLVRVVSERSHHCLTTLCYYSLLKQEEHMAGVKSIINEASIFENPDEVKAQQILREEVLKEAIKTTQHDL
jgi:hypothetical protein